MNPPLTVPRRFCGPPSSGNGGWTAGALAVRVGGHPGLGSGAVTVTLRRPPPLDRPLDVEVAGTSATLSDPEVGALVAEAAPADHELTTLDAVDLDTARAAEASFAGLTSHPFPGCFVCGTDRAPGDGMRIFPGRIDDDAAGSVRVAGTWTPSADLVDQPAVWAAIDCVGGWAGDLGERAMVLGRMSAEVLAAPEPGATHVVVGAALGTEGRRTRTASALLTADGRLVGRAEHVWIAVDPKDFA